MYRQMIEGSKDLLKVDVVSDEWMNTEHHGASGLYIESVNIVVTTHNKTLPLSVPLSLSLSLSLSLPCLIVQGLYTW